jgi:hypothetical protein
MVTSDTSSTDTLAFHQLSFFQLANLKYGDNCAHMPAQIFNKYALECREQIAMTTLL